MKVALMVLAKNRRYVLVAPLGALLFIACKPEVTPTSSRDYATKPQDPMSGFYASSQTEVRAKNNFYYAIFKKDYERKFSSLPATGQVSPERIPYVGSWYPQSKGGTNVRMRGNSPLEKYDAVFNASSSAKAVDWERKNHTVSANDSSAAWAGHCNGYSAAASRLAEPQKQVTKGSTIFYPEDIKALLAEIHMGAKFYFLGGNRCGLIENGSLTPPQNRQDRTTMGLCDDVNPGTFHVAVANWIGIQKYPVIADVHGKEQVWNYPQWKYKIESREVNAAEANRIIQGPNSDTVYTFNPAAKGFRSVSMTLTRSEAFSTEALTSQVEASKRYKDAVYYYILELDEAGNIIGGEWVATSQKEHPDFIWVALEAVEGDGSPYSANPNVNPKEVLKLWAESVGLDPANPPLGIMEPSVAKGWGRFPRFDVFINDAQSGVAFAVDDLTTISLKTREGLGGATPSLLIDGNKFPLDPMLNRARLTGLSPGIHIMLVRWEANGRVVDEQRARFHVVR
jgi:hypothetical protein